MTNLRIALTDRAIARLPSPDSGQYIARDTDLSGFYVLIGKKTRRYMVHGDLRMSDNRKVSIKVSVGEVGHMTAQKARAIAMGFLSEMNQGRHPKPDKLRRGTIASDTHSDRSSSDTGSITPITLRLAWERYLETHLMRKGRSERTIAGYRDHVERVFSTWLDIPLKDLADDADRVARKHDALTQDNGPYAANGAMRTLRAIYNHAWTKNRKALPRDNPVDAVDWNPEKRRDTGMGASDLPDWFHQLSNIQNPVRREFHLFTLLSGCRPTAIKTAKPEHLDLQRRVLHIPKPKGGTKRAFDIPLSRQMICSLIRAIRFSRTMYPEQSEDWIFAADSGSGHISETKQKRKTKIGKSAASQSILSKWGNELRQTHRTLSAAAKVSEIDSKLLMNHAIEGVNGGYITREKIVEDHLRSQQQAISNIIFQPILKKTGITNSVLLFWLSPREQKLPA